MTFVVNDGKYVNMADVITPSRERIAPIFPKERYDDLMSLLFFAYRDFISDPDAILARYEFGRAHHRVLHFVTCHPGMRVADLLDMLKITKQSLGRVLKQLITGGYIEQQPGETDRRERLLFATSEGEALAARLREPQSRRIERALARLGPDARDTVADFLLNMVNEAEQSDVARRVFEERTSA
ncbi:MULTISPECIES: MarR family winged helix-turn-helix transcriptional regulator [unclassified Afifella]|uniref:MarR family winged helix-turn-helix transcriptional regulator n=1 Tax=unclassified Afifella TaxID=2624128 RepID=UPI001F2D315D|nr:MULTISPECIES: MarR family transcriptional regulator [unclassified Afifella]MCF1502531.1 MarR family transcriptional regulator [Afifella sp. H1R]MCT8266189.1 MarR family transcriptional regulator [Afifella sp. JA880]